MQVSPTPQTTPQAPQLFSSSATVVQAPAQLVSVPPQHTPLSHCWPRPHGVQEGPQFPGSVLVLVQPLGQVFGNVDGHEQAPFVQTPFVPQLLPQVPQFASSSAKLAQIPLQSVVGATQSGSQTPELQSSPLAHALPQVPQFAASVWKFTQVLPHADVPPVQVSRHWPPVHTRNGPSASQSLPHAPQLSLLVLVLVQVVPPQSRSGSVQMSSQLPALHVSVVALHTVVQLPQWASSDVRSKQVPLHSVWPLGQTHWLLLQTLSLLQAWPQPPQLFGSVVVLMQLLPHSWLGALQTGKQTLFWQNVLAGQSAPQAPQLASSAVVLMQALLQNCSGAVQVSTQTLFVHVSSAAQTVVQLPQCCSSLVVSKQALPHSCSGDVQTGTHTLLRHSWLLPHVVPQVPQFASSFVGFTQTLLQSISGDVHDTVV